MWWLICGTKRKRLRLSAVLFLCSVGCGSKTGLDIPPSDEVVVFERPDGGPVCTRTGRRLEQRIPEVLFVLDRSGSMRLGFDGGEVVDSESSRWSILGDGLLRALEGREDGFTFGAHIFPDIPLDEEQACAVRPTPVLPLGGANNRALFERVFERWFPTGGTPTAEALRGARRHVADPPPGVQRFVVLATDGAPNCNENPPVLPPDCVCTSLMPGDCVLRRDATDCLDEFEPVEAVRALADEEGVPVYVIGLQEFDNPAFRSVLDAMAVAGRRPQTSGDRLFYDVRRIEQLDGVLEEITAGLTRCVYYLDGRIGPDEVDLLRLDDTEIARDESGVDGWSLTNPSAGEITLHGTACALAEGVGQAPEAFGPCR